MEGDAAGSPLLSIAGTLTDGSSRSSARTPIGREVAPAASSRRWTVLPHHAPRPPISHTAVRSSTATSVWPGRREAMTRSVSPSSNESRASSGHQHRVAEHPQAGTPHVSVGCLHLAVGASARDTPSRAAAEEHQPVRHRPLESRQNGVPWSTDARYAGLPPRRGRASPSIRATRSSRPASSSSAGHHLRQHTEAGVVFEPLAPSSRTRRHPRRARRRQDEHRPPLPFAAQTPAVHLGRPRLELARAEEGVRVEGDGVGALDARNRGAGRGQHRRPP